MKAYITKIEIYDDDTPSQMLIAKLNYFDAETFTVEIRKQIVSSDDLRAIADLLDSKLLKAPLETNQNNRPAGTI